MSTPLPITPRMQKLIDQGRLCRTELDEESAQWYAEDAEALHVLVEEMQRHGINVGICPCPTCQKELQ